MKKLFFFGTILLLCASCGSQLAAGGKSINTSKLVNAGVNATSAIMLTDKDIAELSRESVAYMDASNTIADEKTEYGARLKRLTAEITEINGLPLNFKVYKTTEVNAFACGDGSIRVYSGLMDIMDDSELMAIIGHEIGHVVHADVKNAMKNAYLASAARNAIGSVDGSVMATLTDSMLGDLAQTFVSAQFSQKQEYAADEYGFGFSVKQGFTPYAMANSLDKLVALSSDSSTQTSAVQKMFSSHPDSEKRAAKMKTRADAYTAKK